MFPGPQTIVSSPNLLNTSASVPKLTELIELDFNFCRGFTISGSAFQRENLIIR